MDVEELMSVLEKADTLRHIREQSAMSQTRVTPATHDAIVLVNDDGVETFALQRCKVDIA